MNLIYLDWIIKFFVILIWIYYTLNWHCFHFHIVAAVILMPITLTIVVMIIIYAAIKRHAATKLSCYKHISPITIDNPMSPLPRSTTTHWNYTITDTWILVALFVYIFLRGSCSLSRSFCRLWHGSWFGGWDQGRLRQFGYSVVILIILI